MRWRYHTLLTASVLYALGSPPAEVALGGILASLPDRIETPFGPRGLRLLKHRGLSHEFLLWFVPLVIVLTAHIAGVVPSISGPILLHPLAGLLLGSVHHYPLPLWLPFFACLMHLAEDALTPGGITVAGTKVSIPLCKTGTFKETIVAVSLSMALIFVPTVSREFFGAIESVSAAVAGYGFHAIAVALAASVLWVGGPRLLRRSSRKSQQPRVYDVRMLNRCYREAKTIAPAPPANEAPPTEPVPAAEENSEAPDASPDSKAPTVSEVVWTNPDIALFWQEHVGPYLALWEKTHPAALLVVRHVLEKLQSIGSYPSVNALDDGRAKRVCELLSRITLTEHSLHTARAGLDILKEKFGERWAMYYPTYLPALLAHDIGKTHYSEAGYTTGSHPVWSAQFLRDIYDQHVPDAPFAAEIVAAVRHHHDTAVPGQDGENDIHLVLRAADQKARERELVHLEESSRPAETEETESEDTRDASPQQVTTNDGNGTKETTRAPQIEKSSTGVPPQHKTANDGLSDWPRGFTLREALDELSHFINYRHPIKKSFWKSVSQPNGYVFFHMDLIAECLSSLASKLCSGEELYRWTSDDAQIQNECLLLFYREIRKAGWAHPRVGENYYATYCAVTDNSSGKKYRFRLVPIHYTAFEIPLEDMEQQRQNNDLLKHIEIGGN